ncbi:MAG: two-component system response regulator [Acidobacteria bacterium]|nr:MAG: two-component system response regulator [Acidobacteriota bacterium]
MIGPGGKACRVLLVDDDREIVEMTRMILESGGYQVTQALSGEEALREAASERPDLILLDINMPGMDGWETLKILKVDEGTREIPVAMFSIKLELRDKLQGLKQGAFDYITKPFSYDEILERVRHIFEKLGASGGS